MKKALASAHTHTRRQHIFLMPYIFPLPIRKAGKEIDFKEQGIKTNYFHLSHDRTSGVPFEGGNT